MQSVDAKLVAGGKRDRDVDIGSNKNQVQTNFGFHRNIRLE